MSEWLWIGIGALLIILAVRAFPGLVAPRCPICSEPLRADERVEPIAEWARWRLVWRNFVCTFCMYRQRRVELQSKRKEDGYEARIVH